MIAFLDGTIHAMQADSVVLLTGGVGYRIFIPTRIVASLQIGQVAQLYTHHHLREQASELFGFLDESEVRMFETLLSVSGVGPRLALAILSGLTASEIQSAITDQDVARLVAVPGVGKKTAERIVVHLKDAAVTMNFEQVGNSQLSEARAALQVLGYSLAEASHALQSVDHELPAASQVREALKLLASA